MMLLWICSSVLAQAQLPPPTPYLEPNQGQFHPQVRFLARGTKYRAWITDRELVIETGATATRIAFGPPHTSPLRATGLAPQPGISNYFLGNDPAKWTLGVPAYAKAKLDEVYLGIDVVFSIREDTHELEYDFIVKPGADVSQISIRFEHPKPGRHPGEVLLDAGTLRHTIPRVHQQDQPVEFLARLEGATQRFEIPAYDHTRTLTIDPIVTTPVDTFPATETGRIKQLATDATGALYVTGSTTSATFPVDNGAARNGPQDAFVMKLAPAPGNARVYSAYYGGSASETGLGIAAMRDGTVFLSGSTTSLDLPTLHAFRETPGNCYAARISPTAPYALVHSTYIDGRNCYIAADRLGAAYVTGWTSAPVPTTTLFNDRSPFAMKIAAAPTPGTGIYERIYSTLLFPTPFIGSSHGFPTCIAVDDDGSAIIGGSPYETQFARRFEGPAFLVRLAPTPGPDGEHPNRNLPGERTVGLHLDPQRGRILVSVSRVVPAPSLDSNVAMLLVLDAQFVARSVFKIEGQRGTSMEAGPIAAAPATGALFWSTGYQGPATRMLPSTTVAADDDVVLLPYGQSIATDSTGSVYLATDAGIEKASAPAAKPNVYVDIGEPTVSAPLAERAGSKPFTVSGGAACTPGAYTTPAAFSWPPGSVCTVTFASEVPPATADGSSLRFSKWLDTGSVNPTRTIEVANTPQIYRAADYDTYYPVIVNIEGQGTVEPSTLSYIKAGTPITFLLTAAPGWTSGYGSTSQTWTGPYTVNAKFTRIVPSTGPLQFVPVEPSRIYDSRNGGSPQTSFGINVIPDQAIAVALNITAIPVSGSPLGYLQTLEGTTHSLLNSLDGRVRANALLMPTRQEPLSKTVHLRSTDLTHLVADSSGYFTTPQEGKTLAFYPITPCRLLDSRPGPQFTTRTIAVYESSCGIPPTAQAYSLNATAIPQGRPLGYLTLWPSGMAARPNVSTLNATTGTVTANAAILKAGGGSGSIEAYFSEPSHLVLDINGYFAPPSGGGLDFVPIPPCRAVDTRLSPTPAPLEPRAEREFNLQAGGPCPIPPQAKAYSMQATLVPQQGPLGYVTLWAAGTPRPLTSTLNALDGTITSNAAIVAAGTNGAIKVYATDAAHLILDVNGYFVPQTGQ